MKYENGLTNLQKIKNKIKDSIENLIYNISNNKEKLENIENVSHFFYKEFGPTRAEYYISFKNTNLGLNEHNEVFCDEINLSISMYSSSSKETMSLDVRCIASKYSDEEQDEGDQYILDNEILYFSKDDDKFYLSEECDGFYVFLYFMEKSNPEIRSIFLNKL